jgi:hypothetical protein
MDFARRAALARGRRAEREDALSWEARAFLLFARIAEEKGYEEAERIFHRIWRVSRERLNPNNRPPRSKAKGVRKKSDQVSLYLVGLWQGWKLQNPDGNEEDFGRWLNEWPDRQVLGIRLVNPRSTARRLKAVLARRASKGE